VLEECGCKRVKVLPIKSDNPSDRIEWETAVIAYV